MSVTLWATAMAMLCAANESVGFENPFFVFDNGLRLGEWTPEQQAQALANHGADGIGYSGTEDLEVRLEAFEKHGLRIFNLYVPCYVDREPAIDDDLRQAIERLRGTDVALWLTVQGEGDDAKAARVVGEVADLAAASELKVALYPHFGFYVATLDDALRVIRLAKRDNLGATFNLCHELRAGNEARFDALIEEAAPHLYFVSINGADHEGDWDRLIQPLGRGEFEILPLLQKLKDVGYKGPIGLQCYQVKGDTIENLKHNIEQWRELRKKLKE